jgi:hypothetical protein
LCWKAGIVLCCLGCAIFGITEVPTDGIDFDSGEHIGPFGYTAATMAGGMSVSSSSMPAKSETVYAPPVPSSPVNIAHGDVIVMSSSPPIDAEKSKQVIGNPYESHFQNETPDDEASLSANAQSPSTPASIMVNVSPDRQGDNLLARNDTNPVIDANSNNSHSSKADRHSRDLSAAMALPAQIHELD